MDFNHFFLPDDLLAEFLIRHGYMKKNRIHDCLKIQEKLKNNNISKNLEEVLLYKAILPKPKMDQLFSFIDFLKKRFHGILFGKMAILQKKLSPSDLDRVMITQRSIYLLKKKILSPEELLERKGKISSSLKENMLKELQSLEEEKIKALCEEAFLYLDQEDKHALQWREKHLQGIVGTKYSTSSLIEASKTFANKSINWLLHKQIENPPEKEEGYQNAPPSARLEIPPSSKKLSQKEIVVDSSLEQEQEDDPWDNLEKTASFSVVSEEEKNGPFSPVRIAFVLTGLFVVLGFLFLYFSENKEAKLVEEIQYLLENKKYQETEEKCIEFRKKYPLSQNILKVTEALQELLIKKADISFRQNKLQEAREFLLEAFNLQKKGKRVIEIENFLQEIEKQMAESDHKGNWDKELKNFQNAIQAGNLDLAENILKWLQANATESKFLESTVSLSQELQKARAKNTLTKYTYYPKENLPADFSFIPKAAWIMR